MGKPKNLPRNSSYSSPVSTGFLLKGIFIVLPSKDKKYIRIPTEIGKPNFVETAPIIPNCIRKNRKGSRKINKINIINEKGK